MIQRLKQFIEYKGFSVRAFEQECGVNNSTIKSAIRNNGALGSDKLIKIVEKFPELDANWLLLGKGPMIRGEYLTNTEPQPKAQKNTKTDENTNILVLELVRQIKELTAENTQLKIQLNNNPKNKKL